MSNKNWAILLLSTYLLFPYNTFAANFTVNTTKDAVDIAPGDGVCATSVSQCSLRAAIMETNALANSVVNGAEVPDEININDGDYLLIIRGAGENLSATGDLDITDSVILTGNSSDPTAVIIDGGGESILKDRVLHILSDNKEINVELNYLTVTGGYSSDTRTGGGGICIKCEAADGEPYQPTELGTQNPEVNTTYDPGFSYFNKDTTRPNVTLRHVEIHSNFDIVSGAGIMNSGVLLIEDSVIRDNGSNYSLGMATGQNGMFTNNSQLFHRN